MVFKQMLEIFDLLDDMYASGENTYNKLDLMQMSP